MLERLEHAAQRHRNKAKDTVIHRTTGSANMLTWEASEQTSTL